jgi:WD40 repeat protein
MGTAFSRTSKDQPALTPVIVKAGGTEGECHWAYTWQGRDSHSLTLVRSYTPSGGGAPRLVATLDGGRDRSWALCVWDTGTGAFLGALEGSPRTEILDSLLTYQRPSDGRPMVATGSQDGRLCIWDGDDYSMRLKLKTHRHPVRFLAVYEEPAGKRLRLVTG